MSWHIAEILIVGSGVGFVSLAAKLQAVRLNMYLECIVNVAFLCCNLQSGQSFMRELINRPASVMHLRGWQIWPVHMAGMTRSSDTDAASGVLGEKRIRTILICARCNCPLPCRKRCIR